jgi:glutaconate CoA-transferase subunit B
MARTKSVSDKLPDIEDYNPTELLICTAARLMTDNTTAFIGTGIPMLAASLAQKMHAPNLVTIFEFGGTGAILDELPLAVGGENTFHRAVSASGICDIVETAQRGFIEYGFLGGAQVDPYGNLNSTVIGDYFSPKVRLPGSGGANDVGSHCWRTIAIMRHDRRRFVEKVDFITTPGYLDGPGGREKAGLPPGSGPYRLVSNLAVMGYHLENKRMMLIALQPGVSIEQAVENTGFELLIAPHVIENPPPSAEELTILREEVDKDRLYI